MYSVNHWSSRDFRISVSYRFGTLKDAIKKVRRGISNDDQKVVVKVVAVAADSQCNEFLGMDFTISRIE